MEILTAIFILLVSLYFLSKSADMFTESAETIGLWLKLSPFIVGVSIVAIGTSLPELFSSVVAVFTNNSEIVSGNIVGSNITNILLILGISSIVAKKIKVKETFIRIDLMVLISSVFLFFLVSLDGKITLVESIILLIGLIIYLFYISKSRKLIEIKKLKPIDITTHPKKIKVYLTLLLSLVILFVSAKYTVDSVVLISSYFLIGKEVIAATVVALGTSLPELVVSVKAAKKGKTEIAVGNILGSNIFNVFAVVGISGLFGTILVPSEIIYFGSLFMVFSTFLYYFSVKDRRFSYWDGMFLLLLYVLYIVQIFGWA